MSKLESEFEVRQVRMLSEIKIIPEDLVISDYMMFTLIKLLEEHKVRWPNATLTYDGESDGDGGTQGEIRVHPNE